MLVDEVTPVLISKVDTFTSTATSSPSQTPAPTRSPAPTQTAPPTETASPIPIENTSTPTRPAGLADCIPASAEVVTGQVGAVIDGDTIDVIINGTPDRVRYIGMNAPENNRVTGYIELFGAAATTRNSELVEGQTVLLVKDTSSRDRYGRLLRYVFVGDTFVNYQLVRVGLATATKGSPDTACAALFHQAEVDAQAEGKGMWRSEPTLTAIPSPTQIVRRNPLPGDAPKAACSCSGPDLDCKDFSSHNQAQACFDSCKSLGLGDIFRLDADRDGLACESLP